MHDYERTQGPSPATHLKPTLKTSTDIPTIEKSNITVMLETWSFIQKNKNKK